MSADALSKAQAGIAALAAKHHALKVADKPRLLVDAADWLQSYVPPQWVVAGFLQQSNLYALTAQTNHGKTAVSLVVAIAVAAGISFAGRDVARGNVLILCGENPDGFRTRMQATMDSLKVHAEDIAGRVLVLPQSLPLGMNLDQIKAEARALMGDYSLILVDTSVSFFTGDSEDDNLQARDHALDLRSLGDLPGKPALIVNCHPSKGASREMMVPRGGGAFLNEIDTNLTVWSDGEVASLHWCHKKRGPDFEQISFEFKGLSIDMGEYKVPTVYAQHIPDARENEISSRRRQEENRLLAAILDSPEGRYVDWARECGWGAENMKSKVHRVMMRLAEDKLVSKFRESWKLTIAGKEEAGRAKRY